MHDDPGKKATALQVISTGDGVVSGAQREIALREPFCLPKCLHGGTRLCGHKLHRVRNHFSCLKNFKRWDLNTGKPCVMFYGLSVLMCCTFSIEPGHHAI